MALVASSRKGSSAAFGPLLAEVAEAYERLVVLLRDEDRVAARAGSRLFSVETPRPGEWLDNGH